MFALIFSGGKEETAQKTEENREKEQEEGQKGQEGEKEEEARLQEFRLGRGVGGATTEIGPKRTRRIREKRTQRIREKGRGQEGTVPGQTTVRQQRSQET